MWIVVLKGEDVVYTGTDYEDALYEYEKWKESLEIESEDMKSRYSQLYIAKVDKAYIAAPDEKTDEYYYEEFDY